MTDYEIEKLREVVNKGNVYWFPEANLDVTSDLPTESVRVTCLFPGESADVVEPEPSDCASLANGSYVALYNVPLGHFVQLEIKTI